MWWKGCYAHVGLALQRSGGFCLCLLGPVLCKKAGAPLANEERPYRAGREEWPELRTMCILNITGPLNCLPQKMDQFTSPPIMRIMKVPVFLTFNNNWCYPSFTFWPLRWVKKWVFHFNLSLSQSMVSKNIYLNLDFPDSCFLVIPFLWIVCPCPLSIFLLHFFFFWFVGSIFITPTLSHYTYCKGFHPFYYIF